jgi:hypothetical protein
LKNHVAAGGLKKGATKHLSDKPPLATWTLLLRLFGSTCSSVSARTCRFGGRLAAAVQRQSNNANPTFTDEEVLTVYVFGLIKKRTTITEIHEYVEEHFSDWFPDLPMQKSYNRRPGRLSAVFAPLVEGALSEIGCTKTRNEVVRIADSMPIMLAKGQRASQATVASDRLASVGYCSSKDTFFHGVKLHLVVERRSEKLPVPERAGLTPVKKNKGQKTLPAADKLFSEAVSRVLPANRVAVQLDR